LAESDCSTSTWTPQSIEAGSVGGQIYGQPQWHCGYYTQTRIGSIHNAQTATQLLGALNSQSGSKQKFSTSWDLFDLPAVYLAGVAQDAGTTAAAQAAVNAALAPHATLNSGVTHTLTQLTNDCVNASGYTPCNTYNYDYSSVEFSEFANNKIDAMSYYSEELNPVALGSSNGLTDILFSVTPFGTSTAPFLTYTDVTVISKSCYNRPGCFAAAKEFAAFTWSNTFYSYVLQSKDAVAVNGAPQPLRYLMPATKTAFNINHVSTDPYYAIIETALLGSAHVPAAVIIPNTLSQHATSLYEKLICIVDPTFSSSYGFTC